MNKIISLPPHHYSETLLYKRLKESEKPGERLSEKVELLIDYVSPLLDSIGRNEFDDYTLHNSAHPLKLMHLCEFFISQPTLNNLSTLEICILIFSFYLHDIGMFITTQERIALLENPAFNEFLGGKPEIMERIVKLEGVINDSNTQKEFKNIYRLELHQLQEVALTDYLRIHHAKRDTYKMKFEKLRTDLGRPDLFEIKGVSFEDELLDICVSHNEDSNVLIVSDGLYQERFKRDSYISGHRFNSQFCAGVLRIADILDFDRERTPQSLFDALAIERKRLPGYQISLKEWKKHLSVHTITMTSTEILINAVSENPNIEKAIRDFCNLIQKEVRDTSAVLSRNTKDITDIYFLNIPQFVRPVITSKNYVYKDFSIKLNQESIINLLMGEALYKSSHVALRELVQNSIDACLVKASIENKPESRIEIYFEKKDDELWVIIEDNGIGMDEHVISNYLLTAGESYYRSSEFKKQLLSTGSSFQSISRFGIGFLSVFIISDIIEITTSNKASLRKDTLTRKVTIEGTTSLAIVQEFNSEFWGTKIRILVKNGDIYSLPEMIGYLKENVIRPAIPVKIKYPGGSHYTIYGNKFNDFDNKSIQKFKNHPIIKLVKIDVSLFSKILKGFIFLTLFKNASGKYGYYDERGSYKWDYGPLKLSNIFWKNIGNRVTVNGFSMSLKKVGNLLSAGGDKVFGLVDIDIISNPEIEYDVSRDRLIGKGLLIVRKELVNVLTRGLKNEGLYNYLDDSFIDFLNLRKKNFESTPPLDKELIAKIKSLLPSDIFTTERSINNPELERAIGEELGLSHNLTRKYIMAIWHMSLPPKKKKIPKKFLFK